MNQEAGGEHRAELIERTHATGGQLPWGVDPRAYL
jgi:hypothetical protein